MKTRWRFLFSLLGLIILLSFFGFYFKIKQIDCFIDESQQDQAQVCQQLQTLLGQRILFRDFYHDEQVVSLTTLAGTKEVFSINKVEVSLAGTLKFFLQQTPPLYRSIINGEMRIFTQLGETRADEPNTVLPILIDEQLVFADNFINYHSFLTKFLEILTSEERQLIEQIEFLSVSKVKIKMTNYPIFIIHPDQSPIDQARKLQIIYQQLDPKEIDLALKEIDLRFELPVLKTYETSDSAELLIDSQE